MLEACRCGAPAHASDPERCAVGHVLAGNTAAQTHGAWSFERGRGRESLPALMRDSVDGFRESIISDLGGEANLTTLQAAYVRRLSELEAVTRLVAADLAKRGLLTPKGRVRPTVAKWLEVLATWDKYAQRVGIERRARPVTLTEAIMAAPIVARTDADS
jgi:hypothetical protein